MGKNSVEVVLPNSGADIAAIFQKANASADPVYVYHKEDVQAGIVLDLSQLNRIVEIDTANLVATVEPGVSIAELRSTLAKEGLRFVPAAEFYDPKSLGELFYQGCANLAGKKYGYAKHFLMGSEFVLPTGEVFKTGGKTVKNVTGYDFTRFFNAPYADMGVGVCFQLKLLPLSESCYRLALTFATLEAVFGFLRLMSEKKLVPSLCIWLDPIVQNRVVQKAKTNEQLLLLEFDGVDAEVKEQVDLAKVLADKCSGVIREEGSETLQSFTDFKDLYCRSDVVTDELKFPFVDMPRFLEDSLTLDKKETIGFFGQLAEGKVHVLLEKPLDGSEKEMMGQLSQLAAERNGFTAGKYLRMMGLPLSGGLYALEQQVKQELDPNHILNRRRGAVDAG